MRRRRRVATSRREVTKRRAEGNAGSLMHEAVDGVAAAGKLEGNHVAAAFGEETASDGVIRVIGPSRINHARDAMLVRQPSRQGRGIFRGRTHPQRKRGQTARGEPAIERIRRQSPDADNRRNPEEMIAVAARHTESDIAVAADHFGQALDHEIGPEFERPAEDRRRKRVVHHQQALLRAGQFRQGRHIGNGKQGIGHRFHKEHLRGLFQRRAHLAKIPSIDKRGFDAEAVQFLTQKLRGPTIETIARNDPVALLYHRQQSRCDRPHPRTRHNRPGSVLHLPKLLGQVAGVGMAVAGIDESGRSRIENAVQGVEIGKRVDRGLVEGRDQGSALPERWRFRAGVGHGDSPKRLAAYHVCKRCFLSTRFTATSRYWIPPACNRRELGRLHAQVFLNGQPQRLVETVLVRFQAVRSRLGPGLLVAHVICRAKVQIPQCAGARAVPIVDEQRLVRSFGDDAVERIHSRLTDLPGRELHAQILQPGGLGATPVGAVIFSRFADEERRVVTVFLKPAETVFKRRLA